MFETFCLRLAAGLVFALLLLPPRVVHPRFFRIHLVISLGLLASGAMAAATETEPSQSEWFWLMLGIAGGACLVGSWSWTPANLGPGYACLGTAAGGLIASLAALHWPAEATAAGRVVVDDVSSAGVLGLAMTAMLMGHWYLIAPTMSLAPLTRLLRGLFAAVGFRAIPATIPAWQYVSGQPMDALGWMWLGVRWTTGIIGPLVLAGMAWQTLKIRATQSATGILYVVVVFCFFGELTDQLLQSHLQTLTGESG